MYVKQQLKAEKLVEKTEKDLDSQQKLTGKLQKMIRNYEKKLSKKATQEESCQTNEPVELHVNELKNPLLDNKKLESLEKDLFYYRQTNKELKAKLRELVARNHQLVSALKMPGNDVPVAAEVL